MFSLPSACSCLLVPFALMALTPLCQLQKVSCPLRRFSKSVRVVCFVVLLSEFDALGAAWQPHDFLQGYEENLEPQTGIKYRLLWDSALYILSDNENTRGSIYHFQ